jgi:hypothetical protein
VAGGKGSVEAVGGSDVSRVLGQLKASFASKHLTKLVTAKDDKKDAKSAKERNSSVPCPRGLLTAIEVCSKLRICQRRAHGRFVCFDCPGLMCFCICHGFWWL